MDNNIYNPDEQLESWIKEGESQTQEFKSSLRYNIKEKTKSDKNIILSWLKVVVGFLNDRGGRILLGVQDDKKVCGIEHDDFKTDDDCKQFIWQHISNRVSKDLSDYITTEFIKHMDKTVFVIHCKPYPRPLFLKVDIGKKGSESHFYKKIGNTCCRLTDADLVEYVTTHFDYANTGDSHLIKDENQSTIDSHDEDDAEEPPWAKVLIDNIWKKESKSLLDYNNKIKTSLKYIESFKDVFYTQFDEDIQRFVSVLNEDILNEYINEAIFKGVRHFTLLKECMENAQSLFGDSYFNDFPDKPDLGFLIYLMDTFNFHIFPKLYNNDDYWVIQTLINYFEEWITPTGFDDKYYHHP